MATERATVGGGCFWCIEAVFEELAGVTDVTSGYAGGETDDPTYRQVCTGETGHAEVVQVSYDPAVLSYEDLLTVLFAVHDPTTVDRQGPDVGSQYRSIVLAHDDDQRERAAAFVDRVAPEYDAPIVTEIVDLDVFYPAEAEHQDYVATHPERAYCRVHAQPKVESVRERFAELVAGPTDA